MYFRAPRWNSTCRSSYIRDQSKLVSWGWQVSPGLLTRWNGSSPVHPVPAYSIKPCEKEEKAKHISNSLIFYPMWSKTDTLGTSQLWRLQLTCESQKVCLWWQHVLQVTLQLDGQFWGLRRDYEGREGPVGEQRKLLISKTNLREVLKLRCSVKTW